MSALLICVAAWFAFNAAIFVVLMLRPNRLDSDASANTHARRTSPI